MKVWMVRAGKYGEREELALENGLAVIGWDELPDLSKDKSREAIRELLEESNPAASAGRVTNHAGQLFTFVNRIEEGDLVALPRKNSRNNRAGQDHRAVPVPRRSRGRAPRPAGPVGTDGHSPRPIRTGSSLLAGCLPDCLPDQEEQR